MRIPNLSQIESESLLKDQMKAIKGEGGGDVIDVCLSCFCPDEGKALSEQVYLVALEDALQADPD